MNNGLLPLNLKKLGFGLMRLPTVHSGDIDYSRTAEMIDLFIKSGFRYFDTAYVYHAGESEKAVKTLIVDKYPRDNYYLASKLPLWSLCSEEEAETIFAEQLSRTGAGYFDFYLLHSLDHDNIITAEKYNLWTFLSGLKARGLVRHIGFSFHGTADELDAVLSAHPETEFVQLQINYADWESESIQSRKCYEVARKYNKPIVVMEPIKGGSLTEFGPAEKEIFANHNPNVSLASWALRYVLSLDGVLCVLSGMSNIEQLTENINIADNFVPMTSAEYKVLDTILEKSKETPTVPCTKCNYCFEACPKKIDTAGMTEIYNDYIRFNYLPVAKNSYNFMFSEQPRASDCIACGVCETRCPQNIKVIKVLEDIKNAFEG